MENELVNSQTTQEIREVIAKVSKHDSVVKKLIIDFKQNKISEVDLIYKYIIHISNEKIKLEEEAIKSDLLTW
jgi:hypothetical protein